MAQAPEQKQYQQHNEKNPHDVVRTPIIGVVSHISPTKAAQQDNDKENYQYEFHELYLIKPSALPGRSAD